jgi:hypothetical protein
VMIGERAAGAVREDDERQARAPERRIAHA